MVFGRGLTEWYLVEHGLEASTVKVWTRTTTTATIPARAEILYMIPG